MTTNSKKAKCEQMVVEARADLMRLVEPLSVEQWQTVVISEGQSWTVFDIVAHLFENEQAMSIHVHKIRTGRETVPEGFDLDRWNAGLKDRIELTDSRALLAGLEEVRSKTITLLRKLSEEEFELQGRHPLHGMITIEQYYETIAGHDSWHAKDIRQGLGLK